MLTGQSETLNVPEATKGSEIRLQLEQLEKEINHLEDELGGLSARLAPISTPEISGPPKMSDAVQRQSHSEVYSRLDDLRVRLTAANILIAGLKQRLEV